MFIYFLVCYQNYLNKFFSLICLICLNKSVASILTLVCFSFFLFYPKKGETNKDDSQPEVKLKVTSSDYYCLFFVCFLTFIHHHHQHRRLFFLQKHLLRSAFFVFFIWSVQTKEKRERNEGEHVLLLYMFQCLSILKMHFPCKMTKNGKQTEEQRNREIFAWLLVDKQSKNQQEKREKGEWSNNKQLVEREREKWIRSTADLCLI